MKMSIVFLQGEGKGKAVEEFKAWSILYENSQYF